MSNTKELRARLQLDVQDPERKIQRIIDKMTKLNQVVDDVAKPNDAITKAIQESAKLSQAQQKIDIAKQRADTAEQARLDKLHQAEAKLALDKMKWEAKQEAAAQSAIDKRLNGLLKQKAAEEKIAERREQLASKQLEREQKQVDTLIAKEIKALEKKQQLTWRAFQQEQLAYEKQLAYEAKLEAKEQARIYRLLSNWAKLHPIQSRIVNGMYNVSNSIARATTNIGYMRTSTVAVRRAANGLNTTFTTVGANIAGIGSKIPRLAGLFDRIGTAVMNVGTKTSHVGNRFSEWIDKHNRVKSSLDKLIQWTSKVGKTATEVTTKIGNWRMKLAENANALNRFNSGLSKTANIVGGIWNKLKGLAATYLGIMGTREIIQTTDKLAGAENRLNYVTSQQLGDKGLNEDGGYSIATLTATNDALDKMYASSQRVRTSYEDMMGNVSKNMSLAGDAFDNNIDYAIRFQEIMAEAYAVGGASAAEMSSSMYQLTQALGSGILAGDELRSVREGAPLAYQAIEEFAQDVFDTNESLKELGSQGMITSDIVVAAIMDAGGKLDKAFSQSKYTFGQFFDQIKNSFLYSFQPVMKAMNDALQKAIDSGAIDKFEQLFTNVAKSILIAFELVERGATWVAENWSTVKNIIVAGLLVMAGMWLWNAGVAIVSFIGVIAAMSGLQWSIIIIMGAILGLIYVFYLWKNGTLDVCQAVILALAIVGLAVLVLGLIWGKTWFAMVGVVLLVIAWIANRSNDLVEFLTNCMFALFLVFLAIAAKMILTASIVAGTFTLTAGAVAMLIIAAIALVAFLFLKYTEEIVGVVYAAGAFIYNLVTGILDGIIQAVFSIFVDPIAGILEWLVNAWNGAFSSIGGAFANLCGQLLAGLIGLLKPFAKILDKVFGWDTNGAIESAQASMKKWGKADNAVSYSVEVPTVSSLAGKLGLDLPERFDVTDSYDTGAAKGAELHNQINALTSKLNNLKYKGKAPSAADIREQTQAEKFGRGLDNNFLNNLGKDLGLDFSDMGKFPTDGVGSDYIPDYGSMLDNMSGNLGDIAGNTGNIADSMALADEDLQLLYDAAEREWKKEFTTAQIIVDMTNHNSINGDTDLDGIVTKLTEKLYEELGYVADGVYA